MRWRVFFCRIGRIYRRSSGLEIARIVTHHRLPPLPCHLVLAQIEWLRQCSLMNCLVLRPQSRKYQDGSATTQIHSVTQIHRQGLLQFRYGLLNRRFFMVMRVVQRGVSSFIWRRWGIWALVERPQVMIRTRSSLCTLPCLLYRSS